MKHRFILSLALCLATIAVAGETETVSLSPTPAPRFKISGWIDSGITFNPASPQDNQNFGRFFDDRANEPLLNQLVINFERALAPQPGEFDWGFKLQFMYGSDARYIHSLVCSATRQLPRSSSRTWSKGISTFTFPLSARAAST